MAEEYRLSFTAIEIDEKLQKIDEHSQSLLKLKEDIENLPQSEPIIIDSILDSDSENPVQNKVIKAELDKKIGESSLNGLATESYVNNKFNEVEIPTSLPANGGNADTLEGKGASDFAPILHSHDSYEEKGVADTKANNALATAKQYTDTAIAGITPEKLSVYTTEEVDDMLFDLSQDILTNEEEIDTLKGEGDGSIRKSINDAINEFSTNISNDGVVNTYKELIDYAASHGAEFTELVGEVDSNKSNLTDHINNTSNPHKITPEVIGAEPQGAEARAKEYSDSIVGNLSDYWNSGLQVQDVMSAINANANWVNYNFEKASDRVQNLFDHSTDETKHPSAKATYDLMKFVYDLVMPVVIYDDPKGFEASNDHAGETWHLTGLDLSPYKRIKCYVCSGGDGDSNYSPQHIVEIHLDDRAKGSLGYFTADHAGHCPDNRNRHHMVTFTVNAEKTAIQFQHSISMYGTSASDSVGGRRCYLIEGYKI